MRAVGVRGSIGDKPPYMNIKASCQRNQRFHNVANWKVRVDLMGIRSSQHLLVAKRCKEGSAQ